MAFVKLIIARTLSAPHTDLATKDHLFGGGGHATEVSFALHTQWP